MSDKPTICVQCKNLVTEGYGTAPWRWVCYAHPRPKAWNYVTGDFVADPPYRTCQQINNGNCPDFTAGPNSKNTKRKEVSYVE